MMTETHDVAAAGRVYVLGLAVLTAANVAWAIFGALSGSVFVVVLFGACACMFGWGVWRSCYKIQLSDGYLELRYLYRRRVVPLDAVRRIEFIEHDEDSPAKFVISFDRGSPVRIVMNSSTRRMMGSIVSRRPDIVLLGSNWPPPDLPSMTQQGREFWSRTALRLTCRSHPRRPRT
jgi:hypothetical protein